MYERFRYKAYTTAAFHQSSNWLVEKYVQTLKYGLESDYNKNKFSQERLLDFVTIYRSTPHTITTQRPSEMFNGRNIRNRID